MTENRIDADIKQEIFQNNKLNTYSFGLQLLIAACIFFFCFLLAQLLSGYCIIAYYKTTHLKTIAADYRNLNVLRYAQILASVCSFLLPALIFSKLKDNRILHFSNAHIGFSIVFLGLIPLLIYTIYPAINFTYYINKWLGFSTFSEQSQADYKMLVNALLKDNSLFVLLLNMITIAVIPALAEEWIFRGTFQKLLSEKLNIHFAVLLASIFFSLIHFEFSGFLPRILLGMFLGYLYYYSGSLWTSIFAHTLNNGTQVMLMYLNNAGIYKTAIDQPEMPKAWELIVYTLIFAVLWKIFLHFVQKRKKSTFAENF